MEVNINNVKVHYTKAGDQKQAVILLHGWGQNTTMMEPVSQHLSQFFTVYNLDFPGFGQSGLPSEPWGVPEYSKMLEDFCKHLNIQNPILIAHSFGVRVAIVFAQNNEVKKMVFTGGAGIRPPRTLKYHLRVKTFKTIKKTLKLLNMKNILAKLEKNAGSEDYRALSGVMRASFVKIVNLDLSEYLKNIQCEVLLVWGSLDDATPLWMGQQMEREIPNAGLAIFENDNHYAYFNQMPRFLSVLDIFLEGDHV
ncbi:MAG: alpha/beta hydrolase [Erysipelothrix sp.]|nr:alpha/beta hydrolase [Erysipelothrix sp.]